MNCNCTEDSIDGVDINRMPSWELALRNAAHGHYTGASLGNEVLKAAVREIDQLRKDASVVSA